MSLRRRRGTHRSCRLLFCSCYLNPPAPARLLGIDCSSSREPAAHRVRVQPTAGAQGPRPARGAARRRFRACARVCVSGSGRGARTAQKFAASAPPERKRQQTPAAVGPAPRKSQPGDELAPELAAAGGAERQRRPRSRSPPLPLHRRRRPPTSKTSTTREARGPGTGPPGRAPIVLISASLPRPRPHRGPTEPRRQQRRMSQRDTVVHLVAGGWVSSSSLAPSAL